ncbi:MAG: glycosyltransferase family 2 protein [Lachnospiraceae bacterium]|nr:glycosyltransferase family 2 protein [Lachnospiraceae bacterium]
MGINFKLSIIIPVYNGENHIKNTVRNLLHSSYQNLELLLIDDGSTDGSFALCKKLAGSDSRIKVYHKENGGIVDARNYGLDHATGEYIGFCDQDDEVSEEMYQKMLTRIVSDGSQAAICGCYRRKKSGGLVAFEKYTDDVFEKQTIREKLLLPMLFKGFAAYDNKNISIYTAIWKCIISKQLIDEKKMRFSGFVNYEDDFIMLLQLFLQADRISTLSDILYYWTTNIHSEMHRSIGRYLNDLESRQHNLINYVTKALAENGVSSEIISQYIYVQQCRNALLQLDNLAALNGHKSIRKIKELRGCDSIIYIQNASDIVPPGKGFVRNAIIIPMLRRKHLVNAYFLNQLIDMIRFFVEKYQVTEILERRMKSSS